MLRCRLEFLTAQLTRGYPTDTSIYIHSYPNADPLSLSHTLCCSMPIYVNKNIFKYNRVNMKKRAKKPTAKPRPVPTMLSSSTRPPLSPLSLIQPLPTRYVRSVTRPFGPYRPPSPAMASSRFVTPQLIRIGRVTALSLI